VPDQAHELSALDAQTEILEDDEIRLPSARQEAFAQILQVDEGLGQLAS
jgi:hypothetical protein